MENQIPYEVYEEEEEVSISALFFTVLHKYRAILITALACAVICGAAAGVKSALSGSVSAEEQKAYDTAMTEYRLKKEAYDNALHQYELDVATNDQAQKDAQTALENAQDYAEHSLLSHLDPYSTWTARADLYIKTGYQTRPGSAYQCPDNTPAVLEAYASLLQNGSALTEAADSLKIQPRYLREIVDVEPGMTTGTGAYTGLLTITASAADEASANAILDALLAHLTEVHDSVAASIGSHTVQTVARSCTSTVSTSLLEQQQEKSDTVVQLQTQLQTLQSTRDDLDANYEKTKADWSSVSEPVLRSSAGSAIAKFALVGFVGGFFVAAFAAAIGFLTAGRVYSAKELKRLCDLPILGALASEKSKKASKLDAALNRAEGRPDGSTDAEMLCLIAETVRSRAPEADRILVTGALPIEQLTALAAALQATTPLRERTVTAAESILKAAATVPQVKTTDAILLAADCTCSRYNEVKDQNEQIEHLGKRVLGCIVFE